MGTKISPLLGEMSMSWYKKRMWHRICVGAAIFGKCNLPQDLTQPVVRVGGDQKKFFCKGDCVPAEFWKNFLSADTNEYNLIFKIPRKTLQPSLVYIISIPLTLIRKNPNCFLFSNYDYLLEQREHIFLFCSYSLKLCRSWPLSP